jgi:hypothetical protein
MAVFRDGGTYVGWMLHDEQVYATMRDLEHLLERNYRDERDPETGKPVGGRLFSTGFPIRMVDVPTDTNWGAVSWAIHRGNDVRLAVIQAVDATESEGPSRQVRLGERMLALAKDLYAIARPVFGMVRDPRREGDPWRLPLLRRYDIVSLNSANFFGPEYVRRYQLELFEGIPGAHTEVLPDGGVLYQARPNIPILYAIERERWQAETKRYLASHGIRIRFDGPED